MVSILGCLQERDRSTNIVRKYKNNKICNKHKQKDKKTANLAPAAPLVGKFGSCGSVGKFDSCGSAGIFGSAGKFGSSCGCSVGWQIWLPPAARLANLAPLVAPPANLARVAQSENLALSVRKFGSVGWKIWNLRPRPLANLAPAAPSTQVDSVGKFGDDRGSVGKFDSAGKVDSAGKFSNVGGSVGKFDSIGKFGNDVAPLANLAVSTPLAPLANSANLARMAWWLLGDKANE
jgi:hypothetical protein